VADQAFQLVVRKGPRPGQIFPLEDDAVSVGRDPVSAIVIDDPEISRHHARFSIGPAGYYLQDMASTNGSFVDGQRLGGEPVALSAGQVIMFGSNVTLVYQAVPESDPMATVVAPVSMPFEDELVLDEPVEPPEEEALEVEDEVEIAAAVIADSLDIEEEDVAVEIEAPVAFEIEEEEIAVDVEAPVALEIEEEVAVVLEAPEAIEIEEEVAVEPEGPEAFEIDEDEIAVEAAALASFEIEDDVIEAEIEDAAPEPLFEEIDDDDDLATIIDEPFIAPEPSPEPDMEPVASEGFPTFDDAVDEPAESYEEEAMAAPFVFEEPAPEPEVIPEPEVVAPAFEEPVPLPDYGLDATMPDADFQPAMDSPIESMEPSEEGKGGVDRTVIIAIILLVVMCCCVFGTILALIAVDTWIEEDLIKGLELGVFWFSRGLRFLV
jgi:pSer/pThr/pTyr-binding forkhead associated (FHA) protein